MVGQEQMSRAAWRGVAGPVLLAASPWAWFAVRDVPSPAVDVVAIVLPLLVGAVAAVAGLVAVRRRSAGAAALAGSTLVVGLVAVLVPWLPADAGAVGGRGVLVGAANVDAGGRPLGNLSPVSADLWVVAELAGAVREEFGASYPYRLESESQAPRIGVFSRYPLRLLEAAGPDLPGERIQVEGPDGPFVLYALHVPRPWIFGDTVAGYQASVGEHQRLVESVAESVAAETLPVVVMGDLNSTDRGRDYRALVAGAGLVDAMRDAVGLPTSVGKWRFLLARIDHVLVSPGWCGDAAGRVVMPGSSHRAVTVTVGPCAGP